MNEVESSKEVIELNVETKDENTGSKRSYSDIFIHGNKRRHDVGRESSRNHRYKNDNVYPNLCSSYDDTRTKSHCKLSSMSDAATLQVQTSSRPSDEIRIVCYNITEVTYKK